MKGRISEPGVDVPSFTRMPSTWASHELPTMNMISTSECLYGERKPKKIYRAEGLYMHAFGILHVLSLVG